MLTNPIPGFLVTQKNWSIRVKWGMLSAEACDEGIYLLLKGAAHGFEIGAAAASFPLGGKHGDKAMRKSEEWSQNP